jgi:hypothetical protein
MPYEVYVPKAMKPDKLKIIEQAATILEEYTQQGFTLTLRGLYYQFVSRGLVPENTQQQYKRIGAAVNDGRLAGLIDWDLMDDTLRQVNRPNSWDDEQDAMNTIRRAHRLNPWDRQEHLVEVWIEKDALAGVVAPVCQRLRLPVLACRGYASQSCQWRAGQRFKEAYDRGQSAVVLHLGDHDPSGIDMTRDNQDRINMFADAHVILRRLALNIDQVRRYNPPPNFAKDTDSRHDGYKAKFGGECWELDALEPTILDGLIDTAAREYIDEDVWDETMEERSGNGNSSATRTIAGLRC